MERAIGEVFGFNGVKLQVKDRLELICKGCFFDKFRPAICDDVISNFTGECLGFARNDNKNVIFVEVEDDQNKED